MRISQRPASPPHPGYDSNDNQYWGHIATDAGLDWLEANQDRLKLKEGPRPKELPRSGSGAVGSGGGTGGGNFDDFQAPPFEDDDDLPF